MSTGASGSKLPLISSLNEANVEAVCSPVSSMDRIRCFVLSQETFRSYYAAEGQTLRASWDAGITEENRTSMPVLPSAFDTPVLKPRVPKEVAKSPNGLQSKDDRRSPSSPSGNVGDNLKRRKPHPPLPIDEAERERRRPKVKAVSMKKSNPSLEMRKRPVEGDEEGHAQSEFFPTLLEDCID